MGKHERIARGAVASFKYGQMRLFVITEPAGNIKQTKKTGCCTCEFKYRPLLVLPYQARVMTSLSPYLEDLLPFGCRLEI